MFFDFLKGQGCAQAGNVGAAALSAIHAALLPLTFRYLPKAWLEEPGEGERLRTPVFGAPYLHLSGDPCAQAAALSAASSLRSAAALPAVSTPRSAIALLAAALLLSGAGIRPLAGAILLALAGFDALTLILPDQLMYALCILSFERIFGAGPQELAAYVRDLAVGMCFPLLAALGMFICALLGREAPLGFGDAKLMFALCLMFGAGSAAWALAAGSVLCGAFAVASLLLGNKTKTDRIAYGPFIVIGAFSLLV